MLQDYQQSFICSEEKTSDKSNAENVDSDYYIELDFNDSENDNNKKTGKVCEKSSDKMTDFRGDISDIHDSQISLPGDGTYKRRHFLDEYIYSHVHNSELECENYENKGDYNPRVIYKQETDFDTANSGRNSLESVSSCGGKKGHSRVKKCLEQITGNQTSDYILLDPNTAQNSEMNTILAQSISNGQTTNKTEDSSTILSKNTHTIHTGTEKQDSGSIPSCNGKDNNLNSTEYFDFGALENGQASGLLDLKPAGLKFNFNCVESGEKHWDIERPFAENGVTYNKELAQVNINNSQRASENANAAAVVSLPQRRIPDYSSFTSEQNNDESAVLEITPLGTNLEQARIVGLHLDGAKEAIIQNHETTNLHHLETIQHYAMKLNVDNGIAKKLNTTSRDAQLEDKKTYLHKVNMTQRIQMVDEIDTERQKKERTEIGSAKILLNGKRSEKSLHSYDHRNKVSHKSTKVHSRDSNPNRLQLQVQNSPKATLLKLNSLAGFPYVLDMKAINRLLFGPYSKNVNQILPAPGGRKHKHLTKVTTTRSRQLFPRKGKNRYNVAKGNSGNKQTEHGSDLDLLLRKFTSRNKTTPFSCDDKLMTSNKQVNKEIKQRTDNVKPAMKRDDKLDPKSNQIKRTSVFPDANETKETNFTISAIKDLQEATPNCPEIVDTKTEEVASKELQIEMSRKEYNISSLKHDKYKQTQVIAQFGSQAEFEGVEIHHLYSSFDKEVNKGEEVSNENKTEVDNISTMSNELITSKDSRKPSLAELLLKDEMQATISMSQFLKLQDSNSSKIATFKDLLAKTSLTMNSHEPTNVERKCPTLLLGSTHVSTFSTPECQPISPNKEISSSDVQQNGRGEQDVIFTSSSKPSTIFTALPNSSLFYKHTAENTSINGQSSKSVSLDEWTAAAHQDRELNLVLPEDTILASLNSPQPPPRNSPRPSLDSMSRKSVDFRINNMTKVVLPRVDEESKGASSNEESFIGNAIPFLPLPLAVCCLILNVIVPGSGTAMSGLFVLCCGQPRLFRKEDQILTTMCVNCMVGLAQLFTVSFFLVGWFWSVAWGVRMVLLSVQHGHDSREETALEHGVSTNTNGTRKQQITFDT